MINDDKKIDVSKTTMYVTPKLVKAYNYIAQKTFDHRLKFYTDQLEEKGYFNLENCTYFYKAGLLFGKNQKSRKGYAKVYTDGRVLLKIRKCLYLMLQYQKEQ